jgi:hypothetical protein
MDVLQPEVAGDVGHRTGEPPVFRKLLGQSGVVLQKPS